MTRIRWLASSALVAGSAALLLLRARPANEANATNVAPVSVMAALVQNRDLPLTIAAPGRVEAKASVLVKSRVDGQVADVAYAEGQPVHKGQLLLSLDPAMLEAQRRQAEGVLARDEALLAKATSDYQRYTALASRDYVSKSGLSQSQADLVAAEATVKADRAGQVAGRSGQLS